MIRHFLRDDDLSSIEQAQVLARAATMKANRFRERPLAGPRVVALIFDKPTLRTQLSFTVGVAELCGYSMIVDSKLVQIGSRESIADITRVIERQVAAIVWRTYEQRRLEEMAAYSQVPVVNALTDEFHPCQVLADLLTIIEHKGQLAGLIMAYVGDGANNMAHSYLLGGALAGMHVRIGTPHSHYPAPAIVQRADEIAYNTKGSVKVTDDPVTAVDGADAVITDTWVSMGQETEVGERKEQESPFAQFALNEALVGHAAPKAIVMHCLPAYRGCEISADIIDGPQSVVWEEAENRLHVQKALLAFLLES